MSIEQNIVDAVEISKITKIPVLFMSNPGLGKTTILKRYAQHYGYHLETLIGSRFTPEEINGYQVNNGTDHLTHLNPEWFNRILQKAKEGIKTLLFIDELSTCSEWVQGALLSLIFDRSIGNGKMLPDSCYIVSAANYGGNLPSTMNLMAPTLNRFIIINLNDDYTAFDMLDEFLTAPKPVIYPSRLKNMDNEAKIVFMQKFKETWYDIFLKFSNPKSSTGYLDISNRNLDGIYSNDDFVYNFISGRTLSYLSKAIMAYVMLDIDNTDIYTKIIDGLVGNGTCLFADPQQAQGFRDTIHKQLLSLISIKTVKKDIAFMPLTGDVSKDVAAYLFNRENLNFTQNEDSRQLLSIASSINRTFTLEDLIPALEKTEGVTKFISDFDSVIELRNCLLKTQRSPNVLKSITNLAMDFYGLYCQIMGIACDYKKKFNESNDFFKFVKILAIKKGTTWYYLRSAVDHGGLHHLMNSNDTFLSMAVNSTIIREKKMMEVTVSKKGVHLSPLAIKR